MKVTAKWNLAKLRAKLKAWERTIDKETVDSLNAYGAEAAKLMAKCTPPGNAYTTPAKAIRALKQRIANDLQGDNDDAFDGGDIRWITQNGELYSFVYGTKGGRPGPFRILKGRATKKALEKLHVGKYHVQFVNDNLQGFIRSSRQYYMSNSSGTYHFRFVGARHVTTAALLRTEIRRRQHLAGKLMAGWKPLAHAAKTRLPGVIEKQGAGNGTAKVRRSRAHRAVLTGTNKGNYPGFQDIIDRQVPKLRKKNRAIARRRMRQLAAKMKQAA